MPAPTQVNCGPVRRMRRRWRVTEAFTEGTAVYLWHKGSAAGDKPFGRTNSADLAQRAVDVLNRLDPRPLASFDGPIKTGWF